MTEPTLIQRYLIRYGYLYLSPISLRSFQNLYLSYGGYTCSEVPVGITENTERILDLWNLILYGSTRRYYGVYPCLTDLLLVLQSLFWYFRSYSGLTEHIHVFWILYVYYRTYTCISNLTCILRNLYLCTELILVLQILYLCYNTDSYISDLILLRRYP